MRTVSAPALAPSNKHAVGSDSETPGGNSPAPFTVGSDSEDDGWFAEAACALLGKDAGLALSLETGSPSGSCYKYVTRNPAARRQPPGGLIRQCIRSRHGWQWLCAFMEGCNEPWWIELKRAKEAGEEFLAVAKRHAGQHQ